MSLALPRLEVHVERGRTALRVIARAAVHEEEAQPRLSAPAAAGSSTPTPLLLEATFSGQEGGVWFRLTQQGSSRVFTQDTVARHPALSAVLRLIADEVDGISGARRARERDGAASQELLGLLCNSLLVYVGRLDGHAIDSHAVDSDAIDSHAVDSDAIDSHAVDNDNVVPLRGARPLRDARIERALELLNADISRRWTVELLARAVGLSRPVFARQFLLVLGLTPMRYLTRRRLQVAAALLLGSDAALAEVAARVGYRSEFAFSRAFRKQFQVPPGVYRQRPPTALAMAPRIAA